MKNNAYTLTMRHQLKQAIASAGEEIIEEEATYSGGHILKKFTYAIAPVKASSNVKQEMWVKFIVIKQFILNRGIFFI